MSEFHIFVAYCVEQTTQLNFRVFDCLIGLIVIPDVSFYMNHTARLEIGLVLTSVIPMLNKSSDFPRSVPNVRCVSSCPVLSYSLRVTDGIDVNYHLR